MLGLSPNIRAKDYTPDLTQMNIHWKMPLKVHWTIPINSTGQATIFWKIPLTSVIPLKHAIEVHWKMPLKMHDDFSGVDFGCAIFCP